MFCNLVAVLSVAICSVSDCWASVARPGSRHLLISAPAPESGQCRRPGPLQSRGAPHNWCLASDWSVPGLPGLWLVTGVASVRGNTRQCPPITLGTRRAAQLTECTSHQSRTFSVPSLSTVHWSLPRQLLCQEHHGAPRLDKYMQSPRNVVSSPDVLL